MLLALALLPASATAESTTRAQYVMGTVLEATASGPRVNEALSEVFAEVARWDRLLSLYKKDSELSRLNASAAGEPFVCSADAWRVLDAAFAASRATKGFFDPTILPVLRRGPEARPLVGVNLLRLDARKRTVFFLKQGMGLTLDAFAKGWALDEAAVLLRRRGVSALLNFGGQVLAVGAPEGKDGWPVLLPGQSQHLSLRDASASTSGNSEQPGHIVDPVTGEKILDRPAVTVITPTGAKADAWSTALFASGNALRFEGCALSESRAELSEACRSYAAGQKKESAK